ncbi:MAG: hypothetical protein CMB80_25335 [Flammeovirgaceae bacterium]|nr:hypothetical protein [Flammeovirgaceae bacterium]MBE63773.1 hypothetical protein [Flammeovirgaceae bacterium]MBR07307.1 hypothetical protein [Rickettsiales bacterium]HCX23205.1 hypothetical protein [Cytophagales bacterium]|tara:strand:+ start:938 stop:1165 length:228 start_codon:yes stop_codon:yes gene_type:complete
MDIINTGTNELIWTLLTAFALIGAAILFIVSTRAIVRSSSLGKTQKALLFVGTIFIPVIAPALTIKFISNREDQK